MKLPLELTDSQYYPISIALNHAIGMDAFPIEN
jgi:hypothetical protein